MMSHKLAKLNICLLLLITSLVFFSSCSKTPEEKLKGIAQAEQKKCPQVIDEHTSMIKAEFVEPRTLKYTYLVKTELTDEQLKMIGEQLKPVTITTLKKVPEFTFYKENNIRFEYVYIGQNQQVITQVNIESTDFD